MNNHTTLVRSISAASIGEAIYPSSTLQGTNAFNILYYAITIKPNLKDKVYFDVDFDPILRERLRRFRFYKWSWELDQKKILHLHILASGLDSIKYKLIHLYGWSIDIIPLKTAKDKDRWLSYISKFSEEDIRLRHRSYYYNLFDEIEVDRNLFYSEKISKTIDIQDYAKITKLLDD